MLCKYISWFKLWVLKLGIEGKCTFDWTIVFLYIKTEVDKEEKKMYCKVQYDGTLKCLWNEKYM